MEASWPRHRFRLLWLKKRKKQYLCLLSFLCILQVQLLVSEQDVENYKQIKTDLDQLRLTVEKSELWVEKSGVYSGEELGVRQGKEQNIEVPSRDFMIFSI